MKYTVHLLNSQDQGSSIHYKKMVEKHWIYQELTKALDFYTDFIPNSIFSLRSNKLLNIMCGKSGLRLQILVYRLVESTQAHHTD